MIKRYINKTYRSHRLRDTVAPSSGNVSFSGNASGGGGGVSGLPYSVNDAGEYVVGKTLHSEGDMVAYSDGGIGSSDNNLYLNDLSDVDTTTKKHGFVLTYDSITNTYKFTEPQAGGITEVHWSDVKSKPETYRPSEHTHTFADITGIIDCGTY
ncbi:MAG: hypothetical protein ACRCX4_06965 [Bacteroidales bacterium]